MTSPSIDRIMAVRERAMALPAHTDLADLAAVHDYACGVCGHDCTDGRMLIIDHCHDTRRLRGLLCGRCNTSESYDNHPAFAIWRAHAPGLLWGHRFDRRTVIALRAAVAAAGHGQRLVGSGRYAWRRTASGEWTQNPPT